MSDFFPVIHVKGAPFDMGLTHGRQLQKEIQTNLSLYLDLIKGYTGLEKDAVFERAKNYVPPIEEVAPEILEEMKGIAEGAGVPFEGVLMLNTRTELVSENVPAAECTAIGMNGRRMADGHTIVAQNWDWIGPLRKRTAFFRLEPANGKRALVFCEAGQVCKIGFNESGLGVLLNILFTREGSRPGVPVHVLLRLVLGKDTVQEAAQLVRETRRASSSHFLLGDEGGKVLGVEFSPDDYFEVQPENGAVVHTNHFCEAAMAERDRGPELLPNTAPRLERAGEILSGKEKWPREELKEIFSHHDGIHSICWHPDPEAPDHLRIESIGYFCFDLTDKTATASYGQCCSNETRSVGLDA